MRYIAAILVLSLLIILPVTATYILNNMTLSVEGGAFPNIMVDGSTSTIGYSTNDITNFSLIVSFGEPRSITGVQIYSAANSERNRKTIIEYKDASNTWIKIPITIIAMNSSNLSEGAADLNNINGWSQFNVTETVVRNLRISWVSRWLIGDSNAGISEVWLENMTTTIPSAAFNCTPTSGQSPVTVNCYDNSSGGAPTSWYWMFGEGNTSTTQHPTNVYRPWGVYSVNFSATNGGGTSWSNRSNLMNITAPSGVELPIVLWTVNSQTLTFPRYLIGNDSSLNTPTAWCWSFGDGSAQVMTKNITYQYVKRGVWNASLNASNSAGYNQSYKLIRILGFSQGTGPGMPASEVPWRERASMEYGTYSVSRELSPAEKVMTDCKLIGLCR